MSALTLIEKLSTKHAALGSLKPGQVARSGDIITIRPKHIMTHDNTSAVMGKFAEIWKGVEALSFSRDPERSGGERAGGAITPRIHDPRQPVFAIDHDIQNVTPENLGKYARIEKFAREHGIDFYPAGTGISHQVMVEQSYVTPGSMVVGSDSHSNLYGAACCLGTPVVRTDAASIWATGMTWWQVPRVARCVLKGRLQPGVVGKDVIIALCGLFNNDEVLNMAVEFEGDGIACLSMDQRMSIANMTTEWGALVGIFPFDEVLREYLYDRADYLAKKSTPIPPPSEGGSQGMGGSRIAHRAHNDVRAPHPPPSPLPQGRGSEPRLTRRIVDEMWAQRDDLRADVNARYAVELELDLSTVTPHVSGPDDVKTMTSLPVIEKQHVKINKAYLLSCVNARLEDLRAAAQVINGHKVADGVEFYVAAASAEVQKQAEADGTWQTLVAAGAIPLPSGCGPCIGLGIGTLKAGEVGISATNRNFKGRMGDRDAKAYLGSPAVVAASAIAGYICSPTKFENTLATFSVKVNDDTSDSSDISGGGGGGEIIERFPSIVRGRAIWLPIDNLNTDGIYSGKLTYRDDVTPEEMAQASFNNYDPNFVKIAKRGDIVIAGRNFGTGSSREQAATCLQQFGIPCVIAYSFSETYKRNAFNNGFVVFECPALIDHLEARPPSPPGRGVRGEGEPQLSIPAGNIEVDYQHSVIHFDDKQFPFTALSPTAQELVVAGGAEKLVMGRLAI